MAMPDDAALTILNAIRASPIEYLKENRIKIGGGDRGDKSLDQLWNIDYKAGGTSVVAFSATSNSKPQFKAHAVAMHNIAGERTPASRDALGALTINALPFYELKDKGSDLMMTGQLTACSFAMLRKGNSVFCMHLEPGSTTLKDGPSLEKEIVKNGRFAGHAEKLVVFGKSQYPDPNIAYIVGVRTSGKWSIYAQIRPSMDDKKPITKAIKIL